jgi:USP6 N-terminal-like protein
LDIQRSFAFNHISRFLTIVSESLLSKAASFETILSLLSSMLIPERQDDVMDWIYKVLNNTGLRRDMDGWRKEWQGLVASGEASSRLL